MAERRGTAVKTKRIDGIVDYIQWMGQLSFSQLPMNEIDVFVMCVISYFDLKPVIKDCGPEALTVRDCLEKLLSGEAAIQITGGDMGNSAIFQAAAESERFGGLRITDYSDIFNPEVPLQFMAVTFQYRDEFSLIAYRGTDETIAGWKENFMLSFTVTEAQLMAQEYAEQVIRPGPRYYIAGHSKGGNLALYAACHLSEEAWAQVEHVYILDGPGFCPEVLDQVLIRRVDPKATRIIPQFDIVGKLFEPRITDTRIIRSTAKGALQHSLATWGVDHGHLALAEENDKNSDAMTEIINLWVAGLNETERRALTDELFDALAAGGAVTLSEVVGGGRGSMEAVLAKMFHVSPTVKKAMRGLSTHSVNAMLRRLPFRETEEEPAAETAGQ